MPPSAPKRPPRRPAISRRQIAACPVLALLVAALAGCGGGSSSSVDPKTLLQQGKQAVDATGAIHFTLSSDNAGGGGTVLTGGEGDLRRPNGFSGKLDVSTSGLTFPVNVVSVDGRFYLQMPPGQSYSQTDPSSFGFGDPGQFLDPDHGLSTLLTSATSARLAGQDRLKDTGETLDEVEATLPGDLVGKLLTSADPSQPVDARVGLSTDGRHEVRRVALTGPFFDKQRRSTFTVILSRYGESVTITPPASH